MGPLINVLCLLNKRMDSFKNIYSSRLTIKLLILLLFSWRHLEEYREQINRACVNLRNLDITVCPYIRCKTV